jgi:GNAT superfamily N-acetyltransferase
LLSELAFRSKAHWGYDADFMAACRTELTVEPRDIQDHVVRLLETAGGARGFYFLRPRELGEVPGGAEAELELFYVDPAAIGRGYGRALWRDMVVSARGCGYKRVTIDSDPHAEGFYRAMGARRIGEVPSGSIEGRRLPLMLVELEAAGGARREKGRVE